eukprot:TRINITY_DN9109_c0_g1_i1.p1 TRINITY_DN9109_c0_g1~~TRINITY_DN9109_c0_g1_i1.p1  ORF type:complete len:363 (-),score=143.95 TRINITY_DN9109_c0_g1_i1:3-1061(-)
MIRKRQPAAGTGSGRRTYFILGGLALAIFTVWQISMYVEFEDNSAISISKETIMQKAQEVGKSIAVGSPAYLKALEEAKALGNRMRITAEYQIDLDQFLWSSNRERHVRDFFDYLNGITNNAFKFSFDSHKVEGYHRYSFNSVPKSFGSKNLIIRRRDFLYGWRAGLTTVDMKFREGESREEMEYALARPQDEYLERSIQKIEMDIHACDRRWSRGTRVFFPEGLAPLEKIGDLAVFLKDIRAVTEKADSVPLEISGMNVYYWQLSDIGTLPNGLRWKSTFTFMYKDLEAALSDNTRPSKDGEWSFRLYGAFEGYGPDFVPEHKEFSDKFFEKLALSKWNSDEEIDCLLEKD